MPYNKWGKRHWLSLGDYQKMYPGDYIFHEMPDYRNDEKTCKWCGNPLNKRQWSYCSEDCKRCFQNWTVWQRGVSPLAYRILCRDNFTCRDCGEFVAYVNEHGLTIPAGINLEVHHIKPVHLGGEDRQDNLVTLCKDCHKKRHNEMRCCTI